MHNLLKSVSINNILMLRSITKNRSLCTETIHNLIESVSISIGINFVLIPEVTPHLSQGVLDNSLHRERCGKVDISFRSGPLFTGSPTPQVLSILSHVSLGGKLPKVPSALLSQPLQFKFL